jgi:hypothetical protein
LRNSRLFVQSRPEFDKVTTGKFMEFFHGFCVPQHIFLFILIGRTCKSLRNRARTASSERFVGIVVAGPLHMSQQIPLRRTSPQFSVGDNVVVISPTLDHGKQGVVIQVIGHVGDFVYRYDVQFSDGTLKRFFGFEIDSARSQSA